MSAMRPNVARRGFSLTRPSQVPQRLGGGARKESQRHVQCGIGPKPIDWDVDECCSPYAAGFLIRRRLLR
jgi:hypothetical protein